MGETQMKKEESSEMDEKKDIIQVYMGTFTVMKFQGFIYTAKLRTHRACDVHSKIH